MAQVLGHHKFPHEQRRLPQSRPWHWQTTTSAICPAQPNDEQSHFCGSIDGYVLQQQPEASSQLMCSAGRN